MPPKRGRSARRLSILQKIAAAVAIGLLVGATAPYPPWRTLFRELEYRAQDYLFLLRGPLPETDRPLAVVLIDEASLQPYGRMVPTPRDLLANVIAGAAAAGAKCVGLDFALKRAEGPAEDAHLERVLAAARVPVVIAVPAIPRFARHVAEGDPLVQLDGRSRVRSFSLAGREGTAPLAFELYRRCLGREAIVPAGVDPRAVPIDFLGSPQRPDDPEPSLLILSARELTVPSPPDLRGRIVLVGSGIEVLGDTFLTPYSTAGSGFRPAFGVEVHANILAMLLTNRWLREPPRWLLAGLEALLCAAVAGLVLFARAGFSLALAPPLGIAWVAAATLFFARGVVLPVVTPLVAMLAALVLGEALLSVTERRYALFLRRTFGRYISPEVVTELVERGFSLDLRGDLRTVTVMFVDMANFTGRSEGKDPREINRLLNEVFAVLNAAIFAEQGTVGSYLGDGLMAYFGAPVTVPDHAARACRAALRMQAGMIDLNRRLSGDPIRIRIGLHTGPVVLGSVGSELRSQFGIIGDSVNVASRLEGVNKVFGTEILVSGEVLSHAGSGLDSAGMATRELGRIVVKGREHPVVVYELRSDSAAPGAARGPVPDWNEYEDALKLFYGGHIQEAAAGFSELAGRGDAASRFMVDQCSLSAAKQSETWDGSIRLDSK